jgi:hypothetical protein
VSALIEAFAASIVETAGAAAVGVGGAAADVADAGAGVDAGGETSGFQARKSWIGDAKVPGDAGRIVEEVAASGRFGRNCTWVGPLAGKRIADDLGHRAAGASELTPESWTVAFGNLIWGDIADGSSQLGWPWCRRALWNTSEMCHAWMVRTCACMRVGKQANKLQKSRSTEKIEKG